MIRGTVNLAVAVLHGARRQITFHTNNRFDTFGFACIVKFNRRKHGAVVRDGDGGHVVLFGTRGNRFGRDKPSSKEYSE